MMKRISRLVDALTTTGPALVEIQDKDPFGTPVKYYVDATDPSLPQITARAPTMVTLGTTLTAQNFLTTGATSLYSLTAPAANNVLVAHYTNLGTSIASVRLAGQTAPANGKFKEGHQLTTVQYAKAAQPAQSSLALLGTTGTTYVSSFPNGFM